jgi:hypothetical protein
MRTVLLFMVVMGGYVAMGQSNTLKEKQIVHLQANSGAIRADFGGKLLELQNAPVTIYLPMAPPRQDSQGNSWSVDIRNLGPGAVTVVGASQFSLRIIMGQTVQVFSNGRSYSSKNF